MSAQSYSRIQRRCISNFGSSQSVTYISRSLHVRIHSMHKWGLLLQMTPFCEWL